MRIHPVWRNYGFWFKISLLTILFWFIFALSLSLIIYFSWPFYVKGLEAIIFRFLTWFFLLPSIGLLGFINAMPFMINWLCEDIPDVAPMTPTQQLNVQQGIPPAAAKKLQSYKDVAAKLEENQSFDSYSDF